MSLVVDFNRKNYDIFGVDNKFIAIAISVVFCILLFFLWGWIFAQKNSGDIGVIGSDSFIVVKKIARAYDWPLLLQEYKSQFGIQGVLLSYVYRLLGAENVSQFSLVSAYVFAFFSAVAFSIIVPFVYRCLGLLGVFVYFISVGFSPWMSSFAHSIYWALFTLVLPLTYAISCGWMLVSPGKVRKYFLAGLVFIVLLKCLCGYEYITTITILACAGCALSSYEYKRKIDLYSLIFVFFACLAGFFLALAIHVFQLLYNYGLDGPVHILSRALTHSGVDSGGGATSILVARLQAQGGMQDSIYKLVSEAGEHQLLFFWLSFIQYLSLSAIELFSFKINFSFFVFLGAVATLRSGFVVYRERVHGCKTPDDFGWCAATSLSFVGALSWQVLAWRHMTLHYHLNGLVFAVGLVPLSVLWVVAILKMVRLDRYYFVLTERKLLSIITFFFFAFLTYEAIAGVKLKANLLAALSGSGGSEFIDGNIDAFFIERIDKDKYPNEIPRGLMQGGSRVNISGWAFSKAGGKVTIEIRIKGIVVRADATQLERPDVVAVRAGAPLISGFGTSYTVPTNVRPEDVDAIVYDQYGHRRDFLRH